MSSSATNAGPTFTPSSLHRFKLSGVQNTKRGLGQGCYGYVEEYVYRELKCAGKKLMPLLREGTKKEEERALLKRAVEECVILSELKHPNIVQFLGVHFVEDDPAPILMMEYVPHTLSRFLDKHTCKTIPPEISYGVLVDVAQALCYLHGATPPIIHRDLSANNVLLTYDFRAKISDLGTAKILNVNATDKAKLSQKLTQCPGTQAYMPPEAFVENPLYDAALDCYSYGVLMLHVLIREWPLRRDRVLDDSEQVVVLSDLDRRREYLDKVEDGHPLKRLIIECLEHKDKRPTAKQILGKVQEIRAQCCKKELDRMTLLVQHDKDAERKLALEREVAQLKEEKKREVAKLKEEKKRLELIFLEERKNAVTEKEQLESDNIMLRSLIEVRNGEVEALEKRVQSKDGLLRKKEEEVTAKEGEITALKRRHEEELCTYKKSKDEETTALKQHHEEELCAYKKSKDEEMEKEVNAYKTRKDEEIAAKEKEVSEYAKDLERKEKLIEDVIVKNKERARMQHEALHQRQTEGGAVMEYLRSGTLVHPLHHRVKPINWRVGPPLPIGMTAPQCVLIGSSLYMGGGQTVKDDQSFRGFIFEYEITNKIEQRWASPFLPCPALYFGLGELDGKLAVVGGEMVSDKSITGEVFTVEDNTKWKNDAIPAMRTPRIRACVVSYNGCMAACGGMINKGEGEARECTASVEIYRSGAQEWCTVSSLPVPRAALRVSVIHKTAYFLGGFFPDLSSSGSPKCIRIDLEDLFQVDDGQDRTWNDDFKEAPYESCTPASLCGSFVALGGVKDRPTGNAVNVSQMDSIYAYCLAVNNWHEIDRLPIQLSSATAITLPSGKLLVLGGKTGDRGERNTNVYIGSLE